MGRVRENRERFNKVGKDQGVGLIKMRRLSEVRGRFDNRRMVYVGKKRTKRRANRKYVKRKLGNWEGLMKKGTRKDKEEKDKEGKDKEVKDKKRKGMKGEERKGNKKEGKQKKVRKGEGRKGNDKSIQSGHCEGLKKIGRSRMGRKGREKSK